MWLEYLQDKKNITITQKKDKNAIKQIPYIQVETIILKI